MKDNELIVKIGANISQLEKELMKAKDDLKQFSAEADKMTKKLRFNAEKMKKVGASMSTYLTLPILALGGASVKMASDFEESLNKVDVAFKTSSKEVKKFAETTLETYGIAEGTALDMAALFGDMATSMGLPVMEASQLSTSLVGLAGDLASFKNMNIKEVTTALNGVFTGETESLKRLGIVMTQTNLEQFALSQGITKNIKLMTQAEKIQLRFAYIMENSKNAQGDFARTVEGSANQMRIFQESLKEVAVEFGQIILPLFTKAVSFVNDLVKAFISLSPQTKKLIIAVAGLAAVLGPLMVALGFLSTTIIPALTTGFALLISPIGLVVAGVVALGVVIYKNWEKIEPLLLEFVNYWVKLYNESIVFRGAVQSVILYVKNLMTTAKLVFKSLVAYVKFSARVFVDVWRGAGDVLYAAITPGKSVSEAFSKFTSSMKTDWSDFTGELGNEWSSSKEEFQKNLNKMVEATINGKKKMVTELSQVLPTSPFETSNGVSGTPTRARVSKIPNASVGGVSLGGIDPDKARNKSKEGLEVVDQHLASMMSSAQRFNEAAGELIQGSIAGTFEGLGFAIGDALATGGNVLESAGQSLLAGLGGLLVDMGKMAIQIGMAELAIKLSLKTLNPFVAIAAGTALIALGSVFSKQSSALGDRVGAGGGGASSGGGSDFNTRRYSSNTANSSSSESNNFTFRIRGTDLIGVIDNQRNYNNATGGTNNLSFS